MFERFLMAQFKIFSLQIIIMDKTKLILDYNKFLEKQA